MSLATDLVQWLRRYPDPDPLLPCPGTPGGVRIDLAPVELGDGDKRAVGITVSAGRQSREFFGGGVFEYDIDVYLVGRVEDDPPNTDIADKQGVLSMEKAALALHGFSGELWKVGDNVVRCLPPGSPPPHPEPSGYRVLSCTLDATDITSDDDLRTVTASYEYTILARRD